MNTQQIPVDVVHGEDLCERVRLFLQRRMYPSLRRLRVTEVEGRVILEGVVNRYYDRQLAVECARHVPGVYGVIDKIVVAGSVGVTDQAPVTMRVNSA